MDKIRAESNNFGMNIRTEFSFYASDAKLGSILDDIADEAVNIAGYFSNKSMDYLNFVRLVPGQPEAESQRDLRIVRRVLQAHKVKFKMEKVISVSPNRLAPGVPGGYSNLFNSLWCRVEVESFYPGEGDFIYINVSDLKKAIEILTKEYVKPCNFRDNRIC